MRLPDGLVAAALEILGEPQQHRAAVEQLLVAVAHQRRERPGVGHALAVVAHGLADQRDLARAEAGKARAEDQVARMLVMVVVVDGDADVVQVRGRPQQPALDRVAGMQLRGGELVEQAERELGDVPVCAACGSNCAARFSTLALPHVVEQRLGPVRQRLREEDPSRSPASVASSASNPPSRAPAGRRPRPRARCRRAPA